MPGRRGLCRDEHHAVVGVGVVRQQRHDAGDARLLSLALRADRAAGSRLCRPAVLSQRLERAANRPRQHGRADLARRDAGARHVGDRDDQSRPSRLFQFRDHAAVFPAVRPLSRPRDAAQDARGRRQSRRLEGRGGAPLREERRDRDGAGGRLEARRPPAGPARRAHAGRRRRSSAAIRRSTRAW